MLYLFHFDSKVSKEEESRRQLAEQYKSKWSTINPTFSISESNIFHKIKSVCTRSSNSLLMSQIKV